MKVAIVQEPPVYLNLAASMERAVALVEKAAGDSRPRDVIVNVFVSMSMPGKMSQGVLTIPGFPNSRISSE